MSSAATVPSKATVTPVPLQYIWRCTVEQFHGMNAAGILPEDADLELLEGWLVHKMSKNPALSTATGLTAASLRSLVPAGWFVVVQEPITTDDSEPEPDVSVIRGTLRDYVRRHPRSTEVGLVVEVSDSSLDRDQHVKKRIYARAGVPLYWIVNLVDDVVEVYSGPEGTGEKADYGLRKDYRRGELISLTIEDRAVGQMDPQELLP